MSNRCTSCGSSIPDGQGNSCSMCYGDIDYGSDGYYRQWAEQQERGRERGQEPDVVPCFVCGSQMYQESSEPEENICEECRSGIFELEGD